MDRAQLIFIAHYILGVINVLCSIFWIEALFMRYEVLATNPGYNRIR